MSYLDFDIDNGQHSVLYVGNLPYNITENLIREIFQKVGNIVKCKLLNDNSNKTDPYCFLEFSSREEAENAITMMNNRNVFDKKIRVNWATSATGGKKTDTSLHHHIFVGDLGSEITGETIKNSFAKFGAISNCRVVRDGQTGKSRGYGFISYVQREDAERAIDEMNGKPLGDKIIRANWASRKGPIIPTKDNIVTKQYSYDEVSQQATTNNCTVYVGNLNQSIGSEDLLRKYFSTFGQIMEIRTFTEKGYAFIRYGNNKDAIQAIVTMNGASLEGHSVKCSWGKENGAPSMPATVASPIFSTQQIINNTPFPYQPYYYVQSPQPFTPSNYFQTPGPVASYCYQPPPSPTPTSIIMGGASGGYPVPTQAMHPSQPYHVQPSLSQSTPPGQAYHHQHQMSTKRPY